MLLNRPVSVALNVPEKWRVVTVEKYVDSTHLFLHYTSRELLILYIINGFYCITRRV